MKDMKEMVLKEIKSSLNKELNEAYVTQSKKYEIPTELLSEKTKNSHQQILEDHVKKLNEVSAFLDTAERELADINNSKLRSLKEDEVYNLNASFLHAYYFENIGDQNSVINMDSIAFLRLERDFGSFDAWQKDFIACALSSRNGWAVTVYNFFLNRYMNVVVDLHSNHVPFASYPVIVLDCWEHAYYRDYLGDKKSYTFAMMKELKWSRIEERIKKVESMSKANQGKL
tara:strand:- start:140 stop:826 length:687 start_codon:yes stop_codon:yes gene_type:complete